MSGSKYANKSNNNYNNLRTLLTTLTFAPDKTKYSTIKKQSSCAA